MVNRPKNIGTAAETAVVRYLRANGFPQVERRALAGSQDQGDVAGIPGVVIEVKGGTAAKTASDLQVTAWLHETDVERQNARADFGILVLARAGYGPERAGFWWAVLTLGWLHPAFAMVDARLEPAPIRMHLRDVGRVLQVIGYGTPIPPAVVDVPAQEAYL